MNTIYTALDGKQFTDEKECARHDLLNVPNVLSSLDANIKKTLLNPVGQLRWCGGGKSGCACMGCANHVFREAKLNESHWEVWKNEIRTPTVADDNFHNEAIFGMNLINLGSNKAKTLSLIKNELNVPVLELAKILKGERQLLIEKEDYFFCIIYKDKLNELGATVEIFKDDNAPKKWKTFTMKI